MKKIIFAVGLATVASPALSDEPYALTPSGLTEAILDMPVVDASDRVANGCFDMGWTMVSSSNTTVVCEAQMGTLQSALSQLFLGNAYSTPPKQFIRFNLAGLGGSTRVQATGWIETQMAFGQTRTEEMSSSHYHNNVMSLFSALSGRYPPGTTFPNHAHLGASFEETGGEGLRITELAAGSPGEAAGLEVGDVITRLARERIKTGADILDGMRKAVKKPTYEIELNRGGEEKKIEVARAYRTAVVAPDPADLPQPKPEQAPSIAQTVTPLSAADELAKFATLKDQGVITEEEFEQQKARLLGL